LYYIVAVLINFTYIIKILTLRNWKCNNIILLLLSFLPNFPNTHHVLYFLSSCSFQMVLFYIFGCPLSRSFRLTLPLSYYRNRRAKAKIEEKYSEMPYGIEFFFSFQHGHVKYARHLSFHPIPWQPEYKYSHVSPLFRCNGDGEREGGREKEGRVREKRWNDWAPWEIF